MRRGIINALERSLTQSSNEGSHRARTRPHAKLELKNMHKRLRSTRRESSRESGQVVFAAKFSHCLPGRHHSTGLDMGKPPANCLEHLGLLGEVVALLETARRTSARPSMAS